MAQEPNGNIAPLEGNLEIDFNKLLNKPFSLYIHVPYCRKRCGYCDFNTYTPNELDANTQIDNWAISAVRELEIAKRVLNKDLEIDSIFFGGGTPSLLEKMELQKVFQGIRNNFKLGKDIEVTLEANPDDVSAEKISNWLEVGINRISVGMQSASKKVLQILDRTHEMSNIEKTVSLLKSNGIDNYSFDLIYGTPGETLEEWKESLEYVLSLNPTHISAYSLVIEPGTKMGQDLKAKKIERVDEDLSADKYLLADELLEKHNYYWYEISNWSKSGFESRHNLNYWKNNNWWGIGPGAHSHIEGIRWWNLKLPSQWQKRLEENNSPAKAREYLTSEQKISEEIMLSLRLKTGLSSNNFSSSNLDELLENKLIILKDDRIVLTKKGRLLADQVFAVLDK